MIGKNLYSIQCRVTVKIGCIVEDECILSEWTILKDHVLVKRESIVPDVMAPPLPRHPRRSFIFTNIYMSFYLCYRNGYHLYSACLLSSLHKPINNIYCGCVVFTTT